MKELTPDEFRKLLPTICDRETSGDPAGWMPENPLWSHCAVASVLAQGFFGGDILFGKIKILGDATPGPAIISHYWNKLSEGESGREEDFTAAQFPDGYERPKSVRRVTNSLQHIRIRKSQRYKLLALRLARAVNNGNPIFNDPIYQKCFYAALDSPCKKMKFGCVITHDCQIVYAGCNNTIAPLKSLCEPDCIRSRIISRTESMLGACGHAEEGMWEVIRQGIPIQECELYVAGLYANGLPWFKPAAEHTCLRCAVQMYNARLKTIYVPVVARWVGLSPEEALETALSYATREKSI